MEKQIIRLLPIILSLFVSTGTVPVQIQKVEENQKSSSNSSTHSHLAAESGFSTEEISWEVDVYNHRTGETMTLPMNTYLHGVVQSEMYGNYPPEALKAQAVAARTYVYYLKLNGRKHPGGACVCTDYNCCQAWSEPSSEEKYYDIIHKAVQDTEGLVVTYEDNPILAMYFSSSGGYTENYEHVWSGDSYAYLQSVSSKNEQAYYFTDIVFAQDYNSWAILSQLRSYGYDISCDSSQLVDSIGKIQRSDTGRVLSIEIDGIQIPGTVVRECLGLRSTHFYFQNDPGGGVRIVTVGSGHGVGMSQCGAAAMADDGYDFMEILQHYYTDTKVEWMPFR